MEEKRGRERAASTGRVRGEREGGLVGLLSTRGSMAASSWCGGDVGGVEHASVAIGKKKDAHFPENPLLVFLFSLPFCPAGI